MLLQDWAISLKVSAEHMPLTILGGRLKIVDQTFKFLTAFAAPFISQVKSHTNLKNASVDNRVFLYCLSVKPDGHKRSMCIACNEVSPFVRSFASFLLHILLWTIHSV